VTALTAGTTLPPWSTVVEAGPMREFSLITRDPNPIHWDVAEVRALGLGDRTINQGGLNVAYVVAAVRAGAPGSVLRRIRVRFAGNVAAGDTVHVEATVVAVRDAEADLEVRLLDQDDAVVLSGTAVLMTGGVR
jgi:acyl dehydratase